MNKSRLLSILFTLSYSLLIGGIELRAEEMGQEETDRSVDKAALASQSEAVTSLKKLAQQYRGTPKEADLLFKLSESYHQSSEMAFRVSYGLKKNTFTSQSKAYLKDSIEPLTRLLGAYPQSPYISTALLMRARAYEAHKMNAQARKDYLRLINEMPRTNESTSAAMAMARLEYEIKNYKKAVFYYQFIEKKGESPFLPYALHEMAWSYSHLKQAQKALDVTQKTIQVLNKRNERADAAFREEVLKDTASFYFDGFRAQQKRFPHAKAYQYFKSLESGAELGSMLVRYGTFLRAHDDSKILGQWIDLVLENELNRIETLELLNLSFEYYYNKKNYSLCAQLSQKMALYHKNFKSTEELKKSETLLLQGTLALQKRMVSYKGSNQSEKAAQYLAVVYESFLKLVGEEDPRNRIARANLAEAYFAIGEFEKAVVNYRWIVEHGSWSEKVSSVENTFTVSQASERAISSRYESLLKQRKIPKNLKAVVIPARDAQDVEAPIREWVQWIDTHVSKSRQPLDHFQFESYRTLYSQGRVHEALERMEEYAIESPMAASAIPAATLVMDTYIATQNWNDVEEKAELFMKVNAWKSLPFFAKLKEIAANSKYKQAESALASKDNKKAFETALEFNSKYGSHNLSADALNLANNSAVKMGNRDDQVKYLKSLSQSKTQSKASAQAILNIAKIEEERFEFEKAALAYIQYLKQPASLTASTSASEKEQMRRKIILFSWIVSENDSELLSNVLRDYRTICVKSLVSECYRLKPYIEMYSSSISPKIRNYALSQSKKGNHSQRAVWATLALKDYKNLKYKDKLSALKTVNQEWKGLDHQTRFSLFPVILEVYQKIVREHRKHFEDAYTLRATEKSIIARMEQLKQFENFALTVSEIPVSTIRIASLIEVSKAYDQLSSELSDLDKKGPMAGFIQELSKVAESKSKLIQNQVKEIQKSHSISLSYSVMDDIEPNTGWDGANTEKASPNSIFRSRWIQAMKSKKWNHVGFYITEAESSGGIASDVASIARVLSLESAGAISEAYFARIEACRNQSKRTRLWPACKGATDVLVGRRS